MEDDEKEMSVCDSEFVFYKKTTVAMQRRLNLMPTSDAAWADDQEGAPAYTVMWCDDVIKSCLRDATDAVSEENRRSAAHCDKWEDLDFRWPQAQAILRETRQTIAEHNHCILSLYTVALYYLYVIEPHWWWTYTKSGRF